MEKGLRVDMIDLPRIHHQQFGLWNYLTAMAERLIFGWQEKEEEEREVEELITIVLPIVRGG